MSGRWRFGEIEWTAIELVRSDISVTPDQRLSMDCVRILGAETAKSPRVASNDSLEDADEVSAPKPWQPDSPMASPPSRRQRLQPHGRAPAFQDRGLGRAGQAVGVTAGLDDALAPMVEFDGERARVVGA